MNTEQQINMYMASQPGPKRADLQELHRLIISLDPECKLWFLDGKDITGRVVSNPNTGYGSYTMTYADGSKRDFYRIGLSATTSGISVYVMGIDDKTYLKNTFGKDLGKATVTGYCIRFKTLKDINIDTLEAAIRFGLERV